MEGSVLRMIRFRPTGPGSVLDAVLRDTLAPRLRHAADLRHAYVARHGPDESGERTIVSVWSSADPTPSPPVDGNGTRALDLALLPAVEGLTVEILPVALELAFEDAQPAILRVFRGEVRPGVLDAYVEDVRSGTIADVEAGTGPLALFLGVEPPVGFVTVSAWTGWDRIEAATGGNVRQPIATRHADRLARATASHYEIIPEAVATRPRMAPSP